MLTRHHSVDTGLKLNHLCDDVIVVYVDRFYRFDYDCTVSIVG